MNTVAHIFSAGGGLLVPARDPYERELLVEHALDRARRTGTVRVAVHGCTWNVGLASDGAARVCARCNRTLLTWCATAAGGEAFCLRCAFRAEPTVVPDALAVHDRMESPQAADDGGSVLGAMLQWAAAPFGRSAA